MIRDWYWGSVTKTSKRDTPPPTTPSPSGCFTAVFDFHRLFFPLSRQSSTTSSCSCFKPHHSFLSPGAGNSLESSSSVSKEDETLKIPVPNGIQIKTTRSKVGAPENETSSPGTKTPTLVARLMGLDLLPQNETSSPSLSSKRHRKSSDGDTSGTRSWPATPRTSSATRSDVDQHHHRLSLQINKENMSRPTEDLVVSLKRKELKHEDENRSPGHHARLMMKQFKRNASRKVGSDITNTVGKKQELVNRFKCSKHSRALTKPAGDHSISSRCNKVSNEKLGPRMKRPQRTTGVIRNKQEKPFVRPSTAKRANIPDKKCRKIPLSNELLSVRKDHTKIPQKQVVAAQKSKLVSQLSSCSRLMYNKHEARHVHFDRDDRYNDAAIITGNEEEYKCMTRMNGHALCSRFPRADCGVLEDIDGLIEKDLHQIKHQSVMAYEEAGEAIVAEIEEEIIETLLRTTVDFGV